MVNSASEQNTIKMNQ